MPVFFLVGIYILFTLCHKYSFRSLSPILCVLVSPAGSAGPDTCCLSLNKRSVELNCLLHIKTTPMVSDACTFYHTEKSGTTSCCDLDFHIVEVILYLHLFGSEKYQTEILLNTCESNWLFFVNQKVCGYSPALAR